MSIQLTDEQKAEYLEHPNKCPYCGSDEISADPFDGDGGQRVVCESCERYWWDIYKLIGIEEEEG